MNTKKKILMALALVGCAILLVVGSVAATMAYLTSQTQTITNTFTVGNVAITMDESVTDLYGVVTSGKTTAGNAYKLIPGHTYTKDPTITVVANSEKCYLFVEVVNGLSAIEVAADATAAEGETETIAEQMADNGWINLSGNIWYYENAVETNAEDQTVSVFGTFTIAGTADVSGYATTNDANDTNKITVTAYAVQADGFANAQAAWTASGFGN
ncbi:MAG: hypothetical protein IJX46_02010 [Clostridia bacterium]|nr:hypothetical protein [Clostridia bacterium]